MKKNNAWPNQKLHDLSLSPPPPISPSRVLTVEGIVVWFDVIHEKLKHKRNIE